MLWEDIQYPNHKDLKNRCDQQTVLNESQTDQTKIYEVVLFQSKKQYFHFSHFRTDQFPLVLDQHSNHNMNETFQQSSCRNVKQKHIRRT